MCGIVGFIGTFSGIKLVYDGIKILQNRGYDSCGMASLNNLDNKKSIRYDKCANKKDKNAVEAIGEYVSEYEKDTLIIAHSRWATNGAITDANAHPHLDNKDRVAVVHNGIIENYQELKDFLLEKDYFFRSETDTEVIAVLIGFYLDAGYSLHHALESAINKLQGTWGLAIISTESPERLYLCKNGSPLIIGYEQNFALIASESSAVLNHVKNYFIMEDNDLLSIGLSKNLEKLTNSNSMEEIFTGDDKIFGDGIFIKHNGKIIKEPCKYFNCRSTQSEIDEYIKNNSPRNETNSSNSPIQSVGPSLIATTPDPYPHWMLKEIMEQPNSLLRTMNYGGRLLNDYQVHLGGLTEKREELLQIKNLLILACGTSYHAALLGAKYFKLLEAINSVQVLDASEFSAKDLPKPHSSVGILVLSQSGETKDVHRSMEIAKKCGIFIFSIVNVVSSLIAREADCGVYLNAGREVAVASTKSFTSQVLALALIAVWYAEVKKETQSKREEFMKCIRQLPQDCRQILGGVEEQCKEIILILKEHKNMFILGRDLGEPIAYEGALKIKEIAYLHAEGYPGGSLKHGPFALIEEGTPIIIIMLDDEVANKMEIAAEEVKARGAQTILITNKSLGNFNTKVFDKIITIANNSIFASLLAVLPLQYIAYKLALEFDLNPDYPRNLAKCVTTDG